MPTILHTHPITPRTAIVMAVLALSISCAGTELQTGGPTSMGRSATLTDRLEGRTFLLATGPGEAIPSDTSGAAAPRAGSLTFKAGKMNGRAGCNGMGGRFHLEGSTLVVEAFFSTLGACDDELMARETRYFALLRGKPALTLTDDTLTLESSALTLVFTDKKVADPDRPLVGSTWVLDSLIDGAGPTAAVTGASISGPNMTNIITFTADGRYSGKWGCNQAGGSYTASAGKIGFEAKATTKMGCGGEVDAVENHVRAVFDGETWYTINSTMLEISNGEKGVLFRARGI